MPTLSISAVARLKGKSRQAISKKVKEGKLKTKPVLKEILEIEVTEAEYREAKKKGLI